MAVKTRSQLIAATNALMVENHSYSITPSQIDALLNDILDSLLLEDDEEKNPTFSSLTLLNTDKGVIVGLNQVLTEQQDAITHVAETGALNATFSHTEVETRINAICVQINKLFVALETHGLIAENPS